MDDTHIRMSVFNAYKFIVVMYGLYLYIVILFHGECKIRHYSRQSVKLVFLSVLSIPAFLAEARIFALKNEMMRKVLKNSFCHCLYIGHDKSNKCTEMEERLWI